MLEIHIKDLEKGHYLINHGLVLEIDEYVNCWRVKIEESVGGYYWHTYYSKGISVTIKKI